MTLYINTLYFILIFTSELYFGVHLDLIHLKLFSPHPQQLLYFIKPQDITCHMTGAGRYWLS